MRRLRTDTAGDLRPSTFTAKLALDDGDGTMSTFKSSKLGSVRGVDSWHLDTSVDMPHKFD